MPYLIDGNNLMWRGQNRRSLLEGLARFAAAKKVRVSVVFDGAPEAHFPDGSKFQGVKIYYHERGSNADTRIKNLVESSKERQTLFVVTSDRALSEYVRCTGAKIINCSDFREKMANLSSEKKQKPEEAVKPDEMKEWLRYFGIDEDE